ncbi:MAG: hypothetical protein ACK4TA_04230 [Saprospiraceae bacterium]
MKNAILLSLGLGLMLHVVGFTLVKKEPTQSIFDSLHFQEVLKVEIETDIDSLLNARRSNAEIPAKFFYKDAAGKAQSWDIDLQVRGKFRRRICEFPPLKLTFPKKKVMEAGFNDHNDLKLVVHCADNEAGDEYILREYMAYRLYQILSPESYRVQLLRVKYRDTQDRSVVTRYAILLEDEDELSARLGGTVCEDCYNITKEKFRLDNANTQDLFQYLIGNTDWSVNMMRNVKLLKCNKDEKYIIVPYDFDFSGLVSAPYASVDQANMGVQNVRQRVFLGFAKSPEELTPAIELFNNKRKEMEDFIKKFKLSLPETRMQMLDYLDSFFECTKTGLDLKTPVKC